MVLYGYGAVVASCSKIVHVSKNWGASMDKEMWQRAREALKAGGNYFGERWYWRRVCVHVCVSKLVIHWCVVEESWNFLRCVDCVVNSLK